MAMDENIDENIQEQVREIVAETFGVAPDEVGPETSAGTLTRWTSLTNLQLAKNLEETFGLTFTLDELTTMTSVAAITRVLERRGVGV